MNSSIYNRTIGQINKKKYKCKENIEEIQRKKEEKIGKKENKNTPREILINPYVNSNTALTTHNNTVSCRVAHKRVTIQ